MTKPKNRPNLLKTCSSWKTKSRAFEKDIKALGPVNVGAIEQYDEVKGRLISSSQREDVLAAKNMLLSTINDMNDEVKERFKSTFSHSWIL